MVVKQGDLFWVDLSDASGSRPAYRRPELVIQSDLYNESRINTVVTCAITSNIKRAEAPGNVLLEKGEASLSKQSVVNITQISTVDKRELTEKIGSLSRERMAQVLAGIKLLITPRDMRE